MPTIKYNLRSDTPISEESDVLNTNQATELNIQENITPTNNNSETQTTNSTKEVETKIQTQNPDQNKPTTINSEIETHRDTLLNTQIPIEQDLNPQHSTPEPSYNTLDRYFIRNTRPSHKPVRMSYSDSYSSTRNSKTEIWDKLNRSFADLDIEISTKELRIPDIKMNTFEGTEDTQNPKDWLTRFLLYAQANGMDDKRKAAVFGMFLKSTAWH